MILAIDPGTTESGWVLFHQGKVLSSGVRANAEMLAGIRNHLQWKDTRLVVEWFQSYGMPVGKEVFETIRWVGRFQQAWHNPDDVRFITRLDAKVHLCGSAKAKDQNIRQALLDMLGPQGTKAKPGPLYGVSTHAWAALAVAVTAEGRHAGN